MMVKRELCKFCLEKHGHLNINLILICLDLVDIFGPNGTMILKVNSLQLGHFLGAPKLSSFVIPICKLAPKVPTSITSYLRVIIQLKLKLSDTSIFGLSAGARETKFKLTI